MTPEEHRQVRRIILHSRIGCIVAKMSELFRISLTEALDVFYRSETCRRFHDEGICILSMSWRLSCWERKEIVNSAVFYSNPSAPTSRLLKWKSSGDS